MFFGGGTLRKSVFALAAWLCAAAAADVISLTVNPTSVFGTDLSTGTVGLDQDLSGRFRSIALFSSNPNVASVPESVLAGRFSSTAHFPITTSAVAVQTNVTITATHEGVSRQAVLTIRPPILTGVSFNPNPVVGGFSSIATVTINRPAPANWLCSIQGPFPPIYFMTGSIVAFTPGATTTTKLVNTMSVSTSVNALITVRPPTGQSPNATGVLTVDPIQVEAIALDPPSVTAGEPSLACVTLNAPAPAGGAAVALLSSDPAAASVQPSVLIPAGDMDGCAIVQSSPQAGCTAVTISAMYGNATVEALLGIGPTQRLTDNDANDRWKPRHSTTVGGKVLWTDGANVLFNDGAATMTVQALGTLGNVEDSVFGLGSGASAAQVIGCWRRGSDFAWVWSSGSAPVLVTATNPIDPQQAMNPEAVAIADGSVFLVLQAFANAQAVKHVFRVDPATGVATNLTGATAVPGAARVATSQGQAAWVFDDGSGTPKLHFYDGSALTIVDSGDIRAESVRIKSGRIVYQKTVGGVSHIFLYDSTLPGGMPVRISFDTDAAHGHFMPATDGAHVAWLYGQADETNLDVMLLGGVQLNEVNAYAVLPIAVDFPLQVQRGQMLWTDEQERLQLYAEGQIDSVCATPAQSVRDAWLADGVVVWYGSAGDSDSDNEIFRNVGSSPADADQPMPPLTLAATPDSGAVTLVWDGILGATSYNVYMAESAGVTRANYTSLPGGRRLAGVQSSLTIGNLTNEQTYFFVVTAQIGNDEGSESIEAVATPEIPWVQTSTVGFRAVAADGDTVYAAANDRIYKSGDAGGAWSALGGAQVGLRTRALAADGSRVFGATIDGEVLRSLNGGLNWDIVADGAGIGESNSSIAIDPSNPNVLYAGDMRLTPQAQSVMVKSIDGGDTWAQLPMSDVGDILAYSIAIDPAGIVYIAGTGVPAARSDDGGETWTALTPGIPYPRVITLDPADPATLYIGGQFINDEAYGVYKSVDGGEHWVPANAGLPLGWVNAILVDPQNSNRIWAGTEDGVYQSDDAGQTWRARQLGMGVQWVNGLALTSSRQLLAVNTNGAYRLNLGCPGDVDGDGVVALSDLATLLANFGTPGGAAREDGDLDADGDVDLSDLASLLAVFGSSCL